MTTKQATKPDSHTNTQVIPAFNHKKYRPYAPVAMTQRQWPDKQITQAPLWCSVDLRDGNQALIDPMTPAQKHQLFDLLVAIGFKEIEVGFPAASQTDFDFVRELIEQNKIPDDVRIQILTPAREALIKRSFAALQGCNKAIVHLYNSTSKVQREQVFQLDKPGIIAIAVSGAQLIKEQAKHYPATDWQFEYSPESFTNTELDFAVEICNAVIDAWQPSPENKVIINLPATVEVSTPNIYADQIEWFCQHINQREALSISLHTHNDRGCAVAAAELGVMAGADRVEGTLMGNGERTGNMDVITMAMNLYSQGIDPELDLANMDEIIQTVKACTQLPVHPRHPYAGELVFTAFSGSHQDAINKCLKHYDGSQPWQVAYLPIDPADLGRNYQEVIRINSQSGKAGIAYVMEQQQGLQLPRWLQIEFSSLVQAEAERQKRELSPSTIAALFDQHYLQQDAAYQLQSYQLCREHDTEQLQAVLTHRGQVLNLQQQGSGAIESFAKALAGELGKSVVVVDYAEHAIASTQHSGSSAEAVCYIQANIDGQRVCGVAKSQDVLEASMRAMLNAVNRYIALQQTLAA
ncbi:2-isopropylmalate synthase [Dasania marina]|uniref:2-isopropylmalate synthase n=1 Tax=Dasania marina TaxID=471499 RepID=UPI000372B887|nr:2-isopropylmalate synthase [Dasania marina]